MGQTRIPVDISFEHYMTVKSILQNVLQDFELTVGYKPKWVTCRLNQSGTTETKNAFFMGWVENQSLREIRVGLDKPDPGLFRFMDFSHGKTYRNALKNPMRIVTKDWKRERARHKESDHPPLNLFLDKGLYNLKRDNEIFRRSIAIKVDNRYVGTLNIGLSSEPGDALDKKMMVWSQQANSELVQYLRNEFNLGGPEVSAPSTKVKKTRAGKKR